MSLILFPIVVIRNMSKNIFGTLETHWEVKGTPWEPFNVYLNFFDFTKVQKYEQGIFNSSNIAYSIVITIWCPQCC